MATLKFTKYEKTMWNQKLEALDPQLQTEIELQ